MSRKRTPAGSYLVALSGAILLLVGCGGSSDPTTAAGSTTQATTSTTTRPPPEVATAAGLNQCVNTLLTQLGAPPEHGAELEPAFVMQSGRGHAAPSLPGLSGRASGGVLEVNTDQVDPTSSPVELYFFESPKVAGDALGDAQTEVAETGAEGKKGSSGAAGNVIYLETGPVAPRLLGAINDCLEQNGAEAIPEAGTRG